MNQELDSKVLSVFNDYPEKVKIKLMSLRCLVFSVAEDLNIRDLRETLKWGQPSYIAKNGSTLRMDWVRPTVDQFALYFNCNTKLVETFKELYLDTFQFSGNRAIVFNVKDEIPVDKVKHCIFLTLSYHNRKHLPLLGA